MARLIQIKNNGYQGYKLNNGTSLSIILGNLF